MRFRQPGPRPLRDRGAHRFGLPNLSIAEQRLADHDAALVLKQVGLHYATEGAKVDLGGRKLLESGDDGRMPSFWSWPEELGLLEEESAMGMVTLHQAPVGHEKKKPTSLLTNVYGGNYMVSELEEMMIPILDDLQARIQASKSWSLWAPGLRAAIKESTCGVCWSREKNNKGR